MIPAFEGRKLHLAEDTWSLVFGNARSLTWAWTIINQQQNIILDYLKYSLFISHMIVETLQDLFVNQARHSSFLYCYGQRNLTAY